MAQDEIEILNAYDIKAAHIVGHSMGGYIAHLLAAEFPERTLSITLISSGSVGEVLGIEKAHTAEEREVLNVTWREILRNRPTNDFQGSLEGYMGVWRRLNGLYPVDEALARNYTEVIFTRSRYPVHSSSLAIVRKSFCPLQGGESSPHSRGRFALIKL